MEKKVFDYKKMSLEEMTEWVGENFELLTKERKALLDGFLNIALDSEEKKKTLQAKKPFYELAKGYVEFENEPKGKGKKEDKTVKLLKELRMKAGIK